LKIARILIKNIHFYTNRPKHSYVT